QSSAKTVEVWAVEGKADPARLQCNTFTMEWPPRSGQIRAFPEVDRAAWFSLSEAARKLVKGQAPILTALSSLLGAGGNGRARGCPHALGSPPAQTSGRLANFWPGRVPSLCWSVASLWPASGNLSSMPRCGPGAGFVGASFARAWGMDRTLRLALRRGTR